MTTIKYTIYDTDNKRFVNFEDNSACILDDGRVGFIDTVGRFIEKPKWKLNTYMEYNEEPKEYWYIDDAGVIQIDQVLSSEINMRKSIGNHFSSREEAELAVRKLKAWERMKEKIIDHVLKYEFDELTEDIHANISFSIESYPNVGKDLDLLFGDDEE